MDRRQSISTLFGKTKELIEVQKKKPTKPITPIPAVKPIMVDAGLDPYTGPWGFEQAGQLLRRATFGSTYDQIKTAAQGTLDDLINQLLYAPQSSTPPPLNYNDENDPFSPIGTTWVDAPFSHPDQSFLRRQSLRSWMLLNQMGNEQTIREQMFLFWHNHFVVQGDVVEEPRYLYKYLDTVKQGSLGNFKQLVKDITVDPAMLVYLNGDQNVKFAPNENYARELLELFTIGKGALAGPGDYTTFTEEDVTEIAKVLTGWHTSGWYTSVPAPVASFFDSFYHDETTKQLSHRFDNVFINNAGELEYSFLIDIIFQKDEVARFICRKLYRWFCYYHIDANIEANIIEPMAQIMIADNYDVLGAVEALLRSEHFFEIGFSGSMIKNPIVHMISTFNQFEIALPPLEADRYQMALELHNYLGVMQMQNLSHPNVAGWKAFYQDPTFYRIWINSVTLPFRILITDILSFPGFEINGVDIRINTLQFITTLNNPFDPNDLIEEIASIIMPRPLTVGQKAFLKTTLIPGLPDFEWTVEYTDYLANPTDPNLASSVENKLKFLVRTMLVMPESYLI